MTIACVTRGWRSSARVARRNTSATRSAGASPRGGRCIEALAQGRRLLRQRGEQELVLRRVVAVERAERDLGPGRDVAHLHRVVAAFGRELGRRGEQALLARRGLGRPGAAAPGRPRPALPASSARPRFEP